MEVQLKEVKLIKNKINRARKGFHLLFKVESENLLSNLNSQATCVPRTLRIKPFVAKKKVSKSKFMI